MPHHENVLAASVVQSYRHLFRQGPDQDPVLDLACGGGRNGLHLLEHNVPVIFLDNNQESIAALNDRITRSGKSSMASVVDKDLEKKGEDPLEGLQVQGIIVCNYLHRPLVPAIKRATPPGGVVIYETFTVGQASLGRPRNPEFLLREDELETWFNEWEIIHKFQGLVDNPRRAIANLVARKPQDIH